MGKAEKSHVVMYMLCAGHHGARLITEGGGWKAEGVGQARRCRPRAQQPRGCGLVPAGSGSLTALLPACEKLPCGDPEA